MRRAPWWARGRWRLIALFWSVQLVAAYVLLTPLTWIVFEEAGGIWRPLGGLLFAAVFFALELLFLLPVRRPAAGPHGMSVMVSLAVGGLLVAGLVAGVLLTAAELAEQYYSAELAPPWVLLAIVAAAWAVSTPLLIAFCRRGPRERVLQRVATGLFLGTIVEAAAIIPLDVLVRRREDCVCATGTYFGLSICGAVGLFVLGPAVLLPLLARRRRRWYAGRCEICGYDMSGTPSADRCPECGAGWRAAATARRT